MQIRGNGKIEGIVKVLENLPGLLKEAVENGGFVEDRRMIAPNVLNVYRIKHETPHELSFRVELYEKAFLEAIDDDRIVEAFPVGKMDQVAILYVEIELGELMEVVR